MIQIKARQNNNVIVLDLHGRIDEDCASLIEVIAQCMRDGYIDILCNFQDVDYIDYIGISVIVIAYKEVVNNKGRMKFTNIPAHLRGILSVAGIDNIIDIYPAENLALSSFKEDRAIEKIKRMQLRRRFKRLPIGIKIELKAKYEKSPVCHRVNIVNLSGVGAYICSCDKFKLGDVLIMKMKLPPGTEPLEVEAQVVWLPDKQVQRRIYPGMGVEFRNISTSLQQKIVDFVERNLPSLAAEQPRHHI
ncbi:MAG: PilZ domain-containing protein [Candidatus Omnitrophota bacterium]